MDDLIAWAMETLRDMSPWEMYGWWVLALFVYLIIKSAIRRARTKE